MNHKIIQPKKNFKIITDESDDIKNNHMLIKIKSLFYLDSNKFMQATGLRDLVVRIRVSKNRYDCTQKDRRTADILKIADFV